MSLNYKTLTISDWQNDVSESEVLRIDQEDPTGEVYIKYSDIPLLINRLEFALLTKENSSETIDPDTARGGGMLRLYGKIANTGR